MQWVSQEGADLLWPERVGAGGHASEQRVLHGILHAKLLKVCSRLGDLVTQREPNVNHGTGLWGSPQILHPDSVTKTSCVITRVAQEGASQIQKNLSSSGETILNCIMETRLHS